MILLDDALSPSRSVLRQFSALCIVFFGGLGLWQGWVRDRAVLGLCLAGVGCVVGTAGLLRPNLVKPIFTTWMLLIFPLAWVISNALLALLYLALFAPIGLILRARGRDVLQRAIVPERESYWEEKTRVTDARSYLRQF